MSSGRVGQHYNIITAAVSRTQRERTRFTKQPQRDREKLNLNGQPAFNFPWRAVTMTRNYPTWSAGSPLLTPSRGKHECCVCNVKRGHAKNATTINDTVCV